MGIYKNVQNACKARGVTIAGLEDRLNFGRGSIYKWDAHKPSVQKVKMVADELGTTVDELLKEEE